MADMTTLDAPDFSIAVPPYDGADEAGTMFEVLTALRIGTHQGALLHGFTVTMPPEGASVAIVERDGHKYRLTVEIL